ncbi:MAG: HAD-IIB family hydrolase [Candidatus Eisenbacteria bacterium]|nr:HAD-IIB family hydrolase [Candidatus Eisenbacteria bacterium]
MALADSLVIFTDLDGTLLDRDTYSFAGAEAALDLVRKRGVPLVLASSKTRAEVESYRASLKNVHPFIVENGAAAFVPAGYFTAESLRSGELGENGGVRTRETSEYFVIETGLPYDSVRRAFEEARKLTGLPLRGFGDLGPEEIAGISSLSLDQAELARRREYAEPFVMSEPRTEENLSLLREVIAGLGMRFTVGEKFLHISGRHDKGRLVEQLTALFRQDFAAEGRGVKTAALGDGKNDVEMLLACDVRFVIKKKSGRADPELLSRVHGATVYEAGPVGWNSAVTDLLDGRV